MLLADCSATSVRAITALDAAASAQLRPAYSLERIELRRRLILSEQRKRLARCHAASSSDDDAIPGNIDMAASAFAKATAAGADADEVIAQQLGAGSVANMTSVQEKYKDKVKEKLETRAEELRKEKEARAVKFSQGKIAYERGQYDTAAKLFETALNEEGPFTQLGGEIQMWLALAYQACGRNEECIVQCKAIENSHPVPSVRRQAAEIRYILEAPKLEIKQEEKVQIPVLTDLDPNKGGRAPAPRPRVVPKRERPKTWDEEFWTNYEPPQYLKNRYVWVAAGIVLIALAWYSTGLTQ
ncbi:hypothetical protein Ndes2526B_g09365 [Nannochloris sp. 'desiccata']|nr:hypothetical protein NADE_000887 [Chlorella desiccata (nom. nud.)]